MGLIDRALGGGQTVSTIGDAAEGLSEVFVPNATRAMELAAEIHQATLETASAEFEYAGTGWFDRMINGLNRLPRPMLALGTLGLFIYAMAEPVGFSERMVGLQEVPEPLWWLLGAIVSFYFGARELHYSRDERPRQEGAARPSLRDRLGNVFQRRRSQPDPGQPAPQAPDNPALSEWRDAD
ncbi:holin family protein [Rhodobacteraceae bacterium N5(2021)]|uniref:Holin family protein n=1 Tax=Gymnodinialimonas phycosphaerae TaxID=2841589 RepID=A0A975TXA8_9RHOB|nr:holin family protein [Gymnodinialimonas phycosphaerae]MBY4892205.1 holin family protein [Gymnodinialimonas phycosphaerae]